MLTCRALYPRARHLLYRHLRITHRRAYTRIKVLDQSPPSPHPVAGTRVLTIQDPPNTSNSYAYDVVTKLAPHLSGLESMFVQSSLAAYCIHSYTNSTGSFFTSLTYLDLFRCVFYDFLQLHDLLHTLPALKALALRHIRFLYYEDDEPLHEPNRIFPRLHLESLFVDDPELNLTWWLKTIRIQGCATERKPGSLRMLGLCLPDGMHRREYRDIQRWIARLGPALEVLNLYETISRTSSVFEHVKTDFRVLMSLLSANALTVPQILARITSTRISVLTINLSVYDLARQNWLHPSFRRSQWDAVDGALAQPVFQHLKCVTVVWCMPSAARDTRRGQTLRAHIFRVPQWLPVLAERGILRVVIRSTDRDVLDELVYGEL